MFLTAIKLMISENPESHEVDLKQLKQEESRYQNLRLKSLEYLIISEDIKRCPKHFTADGRNHQKKKES